MRENVAHRDSGCQGIVTNDRWNALDQRVIQPQNTLVAELKDSVGNQGFR